MEHDKLKIQRADKQNLAMSVLGSEPYDSIYYSNFLGEDFIRRAKALAVKSHPNWMARHVLLRYVLQFCLALRE